MDLSHWIGGEQVSTDRPGDSINPSDVSDVVARAPKGTKADVAAAVTAAQAAFGPWADASPEVRSDVLARASALLMQRREEIGTLLAREEGKTRKEGLAETTRAARVLSYFAGEALRLHGQNLASLRPGVEIQTYREPIGVFGLITPWNFPIAIPAWKIAPALAFGNTVVIKPASQTPATAHALIAVLHEAGLPPGVLNMVIGDGDVGQAIVDHPDVVGISFTGSQGIGRRVGEGAMRRQARVQLEMGGKNPLVIMDDADLDRAVEVALDGCFASTGQRCTASSRLVVHQDIHDRFVSALTERMGRLRVGHALDDDTDIGPAVSESQQETSYGYIDGGLADGGRLVAGGQRIQGRTVGWYVQPTLLTETSPDMQINQEEIFGPVASVIRVASYEEALDVANGTEFGLSAGIVTTSLKHARHFQRAARAGMVMVNLPTAGVDYHVPFGGSKRSSYGAREQGFGAQEFYTQTKTAYCLS